MENLDYCFSENGLFSLKKGEVFAKRVSLNNIKRLVKMLCYERCWICIESFFKLELQRGVRGRETKEIYQCNSETLSWYWYPYQAWHIYWISNRYVEYFPDWKKLLTSRERWIWAARSCNNKNYMFKLWINRYFDQK